MKKTEKTALEKKYAREAAMAEKFITVEETNMVMALAMTMAAEMFNTMKTSVKAG